MLALTIAATVHISVLGSFHPVQFELQPAQGQTLVVESPGHTEILQGERMLSLTGPAKVSGRNDAMAHFRLAAPGAAPREYIGRLEVRRSGSEPLTAAHVMLAYSLVRLGRLDVREALLDRSGNFGVQLSASAFEQSIVGGVLHQRVLEGVDGIRRRAATEGQS